MIRQTTAGSALEGETYLTARSLVPVTIIGRRVERGLTVVEARVETTGGMIKMALQEPLLPWDPDQVPATTLSTMRAYNPRGARALLLGKRQKAAARPRRSAKASERPPRAPEPRQGAESAQRAVAVAAKAPEQARAPRGALARLIDDHLAAMLPPGTALPPGAIEAEVRRAAAGYKGQTGDCVVRALATASGRPHQEVYDALNALGARERRDRRKRGKSNARTGVFAPTARRYAESLGATWTATMGIGTGCRVHLRAEELPAGRVIASVSKHMVTMVDGVINDTYDCTRGGMRCVYGYWTKGE